MSIEDATQIFNRLNSSQHKNLVQTLIKNAIRYSRLRVDWFLSDFEGQTELDDERTYAHNAFIDSCNILSRNMQLSGEDYTWRAAIGKDRKQIGDFACLIHAVIGLKAR